MPSAEPNDTTPASRLLQLSLLAASAWAVMYARFAFGPLQEAISVDLALSDNEVAWVQGPAIAVPMALGAIPLGLLVDRYSRVRVFVIFVTLNAIAVALSAFASNMAVLFAARCLTGLTLAAILVAAYSMVGDLYGPEQRGRATMVVGMGEISGAPAAFALGGALLALTGSDLDGWRWALLWMCVPLLAVILLMPMLRELPRSRVMARSSLFREVWPELWRYRAMVIPLLLARIMVWIADGAVLIWGAPVFARTFGLAPERIGMMMATVLLVSGIAGPLLGGPLADLCQRRGGPRRTLTALCVVALLSAPAGLFALMPNATLASVALTSFLIVGFTIGTAALTVATIVIPGELRGLYIAITFTVGAFFSFGVAPLVVSSLSGALGGPAYIAQALGMVCVASSLLGATVFGFGRRHFPGSSDGVLGGPSQLNEGARSSRIA